MTISLLFQGHLMEKGIADAAQHKKTIESLLVCIALTWLQAHGLAEGLEAVSVESEIELYSMLCRAPSVLNPYSRYDALICELVSFQRGFAVVRCVAHTDVMAPRMPSSERPCVQAVRK